MPPKKTTEKKPARKSRASVKPSKKPIRAPSKASPSDEEIAQAAYYRWLSRGGEHGDHEKDWFEAEQEL